MTMSAHYCFYRMTHDTGFAPNPFHGWCTLATCTPNHMRAAQIGPGTIIVGVEGNKLRDKRRCKNGPESTTKRCIVYYMVVGERQLSFDEYFSDPRFGAKKVDAAGSPIERVGDNVYYWDDSIGGLDSLPDHEHFDYRGNEVMEQDKKGNRVFVGNTFYYFGDRGIPLPDNMDKYLPQGQGIKYCDHPIPEFDGYVESAANGVIGLIGEPVEMLDPTEPASATKSSRSTSGREGMSRGCG